MRVSYRRTRGDTPVSYKFDGDKVIIPGENEPTVLDFSDVPPGAEILTDELDVYVYNGVHKYKAIVEAWRDDEGVMWVVLRNFHAHINNYSPAERELLKNPRWFDSETGEVIKVEDPV